MTSFFILAEMHINRRIYHNQYLGKVCNMWSRHDRLHHQLGVWGLQEKQHLRGGILIAKWEQCHCFWNCMLLHTRSQTICSPKTGQTRLTNVYWMNNVGLRYPMEQKATTHNKSTFPPDPCPLPNLSFWWLEWLNSRWCTTLQQKTTDSKIPTSFTTVKCNSGHIDSQDTPKQIFWSFVLQNLTTTLN